MQRSAPFSVTEGEHQPHRMPNRQGNAVLTQVNIITQFMFQDAKDSDCGLMPGNIPCLTHITTAARTSLVLISQL
jgi:hypothetical protein